MNNYFNIQNESYVLFVLRLPAQQLGCHT